MIIPLSSSSLYFNTKELNIYENRFIQRLYEHRRGSSRAPIGSHKFL